jgi:hypothetical protein
VTCWWHTGALPAALAHATVTAASEPVAVLPKTEFFTNEAVGALGTVGGVPVTVTGVLLAEPGLVPKTLFALTLKEYATPGVRPENVAVVLGSSLLDRETVIVRPPGCAVTV